MSVLYGRSFLLFIERKIFIAKKNAFAKSKADLQNLVPLDGFSECRCTCCGKKYSSSDDFFMSKHTRLWENNDHYFPVCRNCLSELFADMVRLYEDEKIALMIMCHYMDFPYYESLYESQLNKNDAFSLGTYIRMVNNNHQYKGKTFVNTLISGELAKTEKEKEQDKEVRWNRTEVANREKVIELVGYDPFESYPEKDRRYLFNEMIKYFGSDEDISADTYKISQIIQIVNNNNQIRQYDLRIARLDPVQDGDAIRTLNVLKSNLVTSNDKIAKENEISVKNRSTKDVGRNTLTNIMKRMREMDFDEVEENYYNQLKSAGTLWAAQMSQKAIMENGMFDENDRQEIFSYQREQMVELQGKVDDLLEENRLLKIKIRDLVGEY